MQRIYKILVPVYLFTGLYAITRYHIYGPVLWKDLPVFTLNKIFIFSVIIIMVLLKFLNLQLKEKDFLQKLVLFSVSAHVILSMLVLKPYYLKNFFVQDSFRLTANISLLFGSLAVILYLFKEQFKGTTNKLSIILFLIGIHLLAMGWEGWLQPNSWYGYFPPITLLSFLLVLVLLIKQRLSR